MAFPFPNEIVDFLNNSEYFQTFMISDIMATGAQNQQIDAEVRICCVIQVREGIPKQVQSRQISAILVYSNSQKDIIFRLFRMKMPNFESASW